MIVGPRLRRHGSQWLDLDSTSKGTDRYESDRYDTYNTSEAN